MTNNGKAIVLTDGKAGHENQSKAFARALGLDFQLVPVKFKSPFHKMLSYLFDRLGIRTVSLIQGLDELLHSSTPPLTNSSTHPLLHSSTHPLTHSSTIIGTGSGTFYAAKSLARKISGAKCGVVLYPRGYQLSSFDCILAPAFDNPERRPNVVEIPANLVANDTDFYEKGVAAFKERYQGATDNLVGVIVGGPNKCSSMTVEWMKSHLDEIFAANKGAQLCVTTSRRTPADVEALVDSYPWSYKLIYSKDHFNPIPAFVQLAKRLYVTAESTGMLSEACTFGKAEVVALDNLKPGPHKFRSFVENLRREGYVDGCRKVDLSAEFARAKALMGL
ncbi:MAG: mitochondrial fission ELM1 family protein [Kiritimatiellae bacterium]|nr:mitochondrial fission ELM1 family protein [Kiritimatiellia bacterium]